MFEGSFTLSGATVISGDVNNLGLPNFAQNLYTTGSPLTISCGVVTASYVGVHGIRLLISTLSGTIEILDNGVSIGQSATIDSESNVVFSFDERIFTDLQIRVTSTSNVVLSYIAAGDKTEVPYGGCKPGQVLPYLQYNYRTKSVVNASGFPTTQRLRKMAPSVTLGLNNMPIEWVRGDLQDVFDLYQETQVVSMLDFESENYPQESWAAFELSQSRAKTYNGTRALVDTSLTFKASV